ncbi:hypothetical protein AMTRI_Chr04g245150 [Amborella trichopoda]
MESTRVEKPHARGHINPMMHLAKILHARGFYITFVNTEFNHERITRSGGAMELNNLEDFKLESIPDGLPPDHGRTQDAAGLIDATMKNFFSPFRDLVSKLNDSIQVPPLTCIISDLNFTQVVAEELRIARICLWVTSSAAFWGFLHYSELIKRGIVPFKHLDRGDCPGRQVGPNRLPPLEKTHIVDVVVLANADQNFMANGDLEAVVDWIPGMPNIRLRDLPSFIGTTNLNDPMLQVCTIESPNTLKERIGRPIYTIGPVASFSQFESNDRLKSVSMSLWNEEDTFVYVNFGSVTVATPNQLNEFAWGLANSQRPFIWVIREDLVFKKSATLEKTFVKETKERWLILSWCNQIKVLSHPAVGISNGVPMICWPFFGDRPTICRYVGKDWGIGMEINNDVKREEVKALVRELMEGEKEISKTVVQFGGSSYNNLERLIKQVFPEKR